MTKINIPVRVLKWIDKNRGEKSRPAFIISLIIEKMDEEK